MAPDISYRITVKTNYITLKNNVIFILTAAWFFAILCMVLSARGDVPHPGLLKKIERGEIEVPYFLKHQVQLLQEGINSPDNLPDGSRSYGPGKIPESTFSAIAILIDFSDNVAQVDPTYFDNLLYGTGTGTVRHYYNEVTYGNLTIVTVHLPGSLGWQRAPQTYAYYVNNNNGFGSYPQNALKLILWSIFLNTTMIMMVMWTPCLLSMLVRVRSLPEATAISGRTNGPPVPRNWLTAFVCIHIPWNQSIGKIPVI
jgi:hypothetical protein